MNRDFIGVGWSAPTAVNASGGIGLARCETDVAQAIRLILLTPRGSRVMRPSFGCQIHDIHLDPNDANTSAIAARYVREALELWEPRIRVIGVSVRRDEDRPECLLIEIQYEVKANYARRALVFPFYRIPGEGPSAR